MFLATRLNFSVGERGVSFEDVNQRELRLAELSSCSAYATAKSLGKAGANQNLAR